MVPELFMMRIKDDYFTSLTRSQVMLLLGMVRDCGVSSFDVSEEIDRKEVWGIFGIAPPKKEEQNG